MDSEETRNVINCQNIMMTSDKHQSGTDRVAEVADNFDCDVVVNIQGDEPGINPLLIDQLIQLFEDPCVEMASIASTDLKENDLNNDNVVKVNLDEENNAISFIRNKGYFDQISITEDDRRRAQTYLDNKKRDKHDEKNSLFNQYLKRANN